MRALSPKRAKPSRRGRPLLLVALLFGAASLLARPAARADAAHPTVYVLLKLDAKASVVEKILADHLPGLTVKVFGTFRDFDGAAATDNPDALLVIPPLLEARGKKATLQGTRGGKESEPWVLVSVGKPLEGPLAGKTIGMVDLLGRDGTQAFIGKVTKDKDFKVKRVAKVEDLVPLLEFSAAQALLVPSAMLADFAKHTRLALKTRELPDGGQVGLPAVAVLNPAAKDAVVKAFSGLDAATKAVLGIDAWSPK
jgi:hypothetical protein